MTAYSPTSPSYSPPPEDEVDLPEVRSEEPQQLADEHTPSPPLEAYAPGVRPTVVESSEDDTMEEGGSPSSRKGSLGRPSLDSLATPPVNFRATPAFIQCAAATVPLEGDLPAVDMRRLDVSQRSVVGELQAAVRNLTDATILNPIDLTRSTPRRSAGAANRREKKMLEKRVLSTAQRFWAAVRREDDRWADLATASAASFDRQRLLLAVLRSQDVQLASRQ